MSKILIVDDDRSIIDLLQAVLSSKGYDVIIAMDGKAGLASAKEYKPDIIILDVMMPEMDGFTVSGLLFQDPAMRMIPVLILTAQGNTQKIFDLVPNVRCYMNKPFDPSDLLDKIR